MRKHIKSLSILLALFFVLSAFSGCQAIYNITAPKEFKESAEAYEDYPEDTLPVYEGAIVYDYEEDEDNIVLKFGSKSNFDDVTKFYMDYFEDNEIYLSNEKDRSKSYLADGEQGFYEFNLTIENPSGKWEERLFLSTAEIELKKMNIPNKNSIYNFIEQTKDHLEIFNEIYDTYYMLEDSEEEDITYFIDESEVVLSKLTDIDSELDSRKVPDIESYISLQSTEKEIVEILTHIFEDYKAYAEYSDLFLVYAEDYLNFDDSNYDQFDDLVSIYGNLVDNIEGMTVPSFIENFHTSFTKILKDIIGTSKYCMDAIDNKDNVLFYAGLYSYQINLRDLKELFITYEKDTELLSNRREEELENIKVSSDGISEWLVTAKSEVQDDAPELTALSEEYIMQDVKAEVICDYDYPEKIIPANYRSMKNITFLQLSTSKGEKTVLLSVEIPGFTQKFEQKLEISRAETEISVHPPLLSNAIAELNSNKDAQLIITVEDVDSGELVVQDTLDVTIYSRYDMQWYDDYDNSYIENILAWMTPEADEISKLIRLAADSADYLTGGELDSIVGYQHVSDWTEAQITYVQSVALMHALASQMNVKYIAEPFSATSTSLQRVKTPAQVINEEGGLCAETAVTIASAFQAMGMHPVLIFPPGHVHVAVETWYGSGEYLFVETTALSSAADENFDYVVAYLTPDEWAAYLDQDGYIVVDCSLADEYGIKSID